jgi:hypothetical protein
MIDSSSGDNNITDVNSSREASTAKTPATNSKQASNSRDTSKNRGACNSTRNSRYVRRRDASNFN